MCDKYKTAKIPSITSRTVDIIRTVYFIHALDVIERIFAVLCVAYGPYTVLIKLFFLHL